LLLGGLMGMRCLTFSKDDVVMKEGRSYRRIFQIARGSCRIEKRVNTPEVANSSSSEGDLKLSKKKKNKKKEKKPYQCCTWKNG